MYRRLLAFFNKIDKLINKIFPMLGILYVWFNIDTISVSYILLLIGLQSLFNVTRDPQAYHYFCLEMEREKESTFRNLHWWMGVWGIRSCVYAIMIVFCCLVIQKDIYMKFPNVTEMMFVGLPILYEKVSLSSTRKVLLSYKREDFERGMFLEMGISLGEVLIFLLLTFIFQLKLFDTYSNTLYVLMLLKSLMMFELAVYNWKEKVRKKYFIENAIHTFSQEEELTIFRPPYAYYCKAIWLPNILSIFKNFLIITVITL